MRSPTAGYSAAVGLFVLVACSPEYFSLAVDVAVVGNDASERHHAETANSLAAYCQGPETVTLGPRGFVVCWTLAVSL